ncbi:MAG: ABC transporter ATP-binding protein [Fusobacteria bacterium]|nr:MAG: ABC transporter ATP-binding protein [Fusobacteriota bacterium]
MISTSNLGLSFPGKKLFDDVNIKFTPGNCYGLIGANGAGKSTFLKILAGEIDSTEGEVILGPKQRLSFLQQDHFAFADEVVLDVVMMGHKELYAIKKEQEELYAKPDATEEDYARAGDLTDRIEELDGWSAETNAEKLLTGLGIKPELHYRIMNELTEPERVKILLAQALFGEPDVLLLDEPTNGLDLHAINWLENFLLNFNETVIVVSHDRHFLNKVCTHIADIDFGKIKIFVGNYDFWYESSQVVLELIRNKNKKLEQKREELKTFIARFSANASKSNQATARKKMLENLKFEDMQVSNRKYPFIEFKSNRDAGNNMLKVENLTKTIDGVKVLNNITFTINTGDKVVFLAKSDIVKTTLIKILAGELEPDSGEITWGVTTSLGYMPRDNSSFFTPDSGDNLIDWLRPYSPDQHESFIRGFLGRMLFSGEDAQKKPSVLSGGEKVRCMLSKTMMTGANVYLFDNPTDHLDLESIQSLNKALIKFNGTVMFAAHDHEFIQTIANRIIEITPNGIVDKLMEFDEYIKDEAVEARLAEMYKEK